MAYNKYYIDEYGNVTEIEVGIENFDEYYLEEEFRKNTTDSNYDNTKIHIGDYVNYPVSYTDQSNMTEVSSNQAWRICGITDNSIELISAQIPLSVSIGIWGDVSYINPNVIVYEYENFYNGLTLGSYEPNWDIPESSITDKASYKAELLDLKNEKYANNIRVITLDDIFNIEGSSITDGAEVTNKLLKNQSFLTATRFERRE